MSSSQFGDEEMLFADWPSVSFTPVNPSPIISPKIHYDNRVQAPRIRRHDIYDIPPEPVEEPQSGRKRKRSQGNTAKSIAITRSLENLWQSDAQSYPSNELSVTEDADMVSPNVITTSSSTKQTGKIRAKPRKQKQIELSGLSVVKLQLRSEKASFHHIQSHPVSSHTTTEDLLRSNDLAKTTLEKLAAFRHIPLPSVALAEEPFSSVNRPCSVDTIAPRDDRCQHPLTSLHPPDQALEDEKFFDEAFIRAEPASDTFLNAFQSNEKILVDNITTSYAFTSVDVQSSIVENNTGCGPFRKECDEFDGQGLEDNDILAIADSLTRYSAQDSEIVDRFDGASVPDYASDVTRRHSSAHQSLDVDDFPIDEDDEMEMSNLVHHDVCQTLQVSNVDLALVQTQLEEVDVVSGSHSHTSGVDRSKCKAIGTIGTSGSSPSPTGLLTPYSSPLLLNGAVSRTVLKFQGHSVEGQLCQLSTCSKDERPLEDGSDYSPLEPFARPDFPAKIRDRSPVTGLSSNIFLRTCFRIGEALRVGGLCNAENQDMVIELFARVKDSTRETGTFRQHYQFADLFHDRPPVLKAILENVKITALQETESSKLIGDENSGQLIRSLGRLKRTVTGTGWLFHILNVRASDWEEVRWTKKIAGAGMVKSNVDLRYRL